MQDRFKFRYFYNGAIYDVFAVDFMNKTAQLVSLDRKETLFKGIDTAKLIQCTGLKDKSGKLIYEGDIVKSDFYFITNAINPLRFNIGNVFYSNYIAGFVIASDINDYSPYKTSFFGKTEALNCIVIGNIYENNPELLEGKNDGKE